MLFTQINRFIMAFVITSFISGCSEQGEINTNASTVVLSEKTKQAQVILDNYYGNRDSLVNAAKLVSEILTENDQYAPAYAQMSRIILLGGHVVSYNFRGGTHEKARMALERAIELDPNYAESYVLMGYVDGLSGRPDSANKNLMKAIRLGSKNPWIYNNLGDAKFHSKSYNEADHFYKKTVKLGVGETAQQRRAYVSALTQQMNIAYQRSDTELVVRLASLATEAAAPEDAWTWGNSGGLLCRSGRLDLGIEYNRKALSIMSYGVGKYNLSYCLYGKGAELVSQGDAARSQPFFQEAYQLNPDIMGVADDFLNTDIEHLREILINKQKSV